MEKEMMGWSALAFGLVILVFSVCPSNAIRPITCIEALTSLLPCQPFLVGFGPETPGFPCCFGVQNVVKKATTTEIRRALCECFKESAKSLGVKPERAKLIPKSCGVTVPVPIGPNVNCTT